MDFTNLINALGSAGINQLGNTAANNQIQQGVTQGSGYIKSAYDTNKTNLDPYMNMTTNVAGNGQTNAQNFQTSLDNMGKQYTLADFNNSAYGQLADRTIADNQAALSANYAAKGVYGTGNMMNDIQQNALTTRLGAYDNANYRNASDKSAAFNANLNVNNQGFSAAQALGNNAMQAGIAQGNLAGQAAAAKAGTAAQTAGIATQAFQSAIGSLAPLAIAAWQKLIGGLSLSQAEQDLITQTQSDVVDSIDSNYKLSGLSNGTEWWDNVLGDIDLADYGGI